MRASFLTLMLPWCLAAAEPPTLPKAETLDPERVRKAEEALAKLADEKPAVVVAVDPALLEKLTKAEKAMEECDAFAKVKQAASAGERYITARDLLNAIPEESRPGIGPRYRRARTELDRLTLQLLAQEGLKPETVPSLDDLPDGRDQAQPGTTPQTGSPLPGKPAAPKPASRPPVVEDRG